LLEDVGFAGCGVVGNDFPFGLAFAGFGGDQPVAERSF